MRAEEEEAAMLRSAGRPVWGLCPVRACGLSWCVWALVRSIGNRRKNEAIGVLVHRHEKGRKKDARKGRIGACCTTLMDTHRWIRKEKKREKRKETSNRWVGDRWYMRTEYKEKGVAEASY